MQIIFFVPLLFVFILTIWGITGFVIKERPVVPIICGRNEEAPHLSPWQVDLQIDNRIYDRTLISNCGVQMATHCTTGTRLPEFEVMVD